MYMLVVKVYYHQVELHEAAGMVVAVLIVQVVATLQAVAVVVPI